MTHALLIAVGAFFGASARYGASQLGKRFNSQIPGGTLFVNLLGALLLGFITGLQIGSIWMLLLGTGFMGSFTTFSTFKFENITLHKERKWNISLVYLGISYMFGILLAFVGFTWGHAITFR